MSYLKMEGTTDYLVAFPALLSSFKVSTGWSVTAGQAVSLDSSGNVFPSTMADASSFVGIVYQNQTAGNIVGVINWGYVKNIVASGSITPGSWLTIASGSVNGLFAPYSLTDPKAIVGKAVTSPSTSSTFMAFISALG